MLIACLLHAGCSVVSIKDYRNAETHEIRQAIIYGGEINDVAGFEVVPNFRTFTSSFPVRYSSLVVLSEKPEKIFIKSASLTDPVSGKVETLQLNKNYYTNRELRDSGFLIESIRLFGTGKSDYSSFKDAKTLNLSVELAIGDSPLSTLRFRLRLVEYKDIAWPT
ncbi:hypothetical protein [Microbulbifer aggregans]|uniref:hypothetical protein n=1 Tax=Microbulbifer aggregans TaxID=1769779 RepID=UPI001CFE1DE5|nr:hypothetical protein [Microbulbifer aggregans]